MTSNLGKIMEVKDFIADVTLLIGLGPTTLLMFAFAMLSTQILFTWLGMTHIPKD
jgi:hypothetical protein